MKQTGSAANLDKSPCRRGGPYVFKRHADLAEETAHHRGVGFDASLGRKAIAESLKPDIRLLGPRRLEELPIRYQLGGAMAAMSDRLARALAFNPFEAPGDWCSGSGWRRWC